MYSAWRNPSPWSWKAVREFTTVFSVIGFELPFLLHWDSDLIFTALGFQHCRKVTTGLSFGSLACDYLLHSNGTSFFTTSSRGLVHRAHSMKLWCMGNPREHWARPRKIPGLRNKMGEKWAVTGRCLHAKFLRSIKHYAFESMETILGAWGSKHMMLSQRIQVLFSAPASGDLHL